MRNSVFCHLENLDICPYDLFGCGLWIVVFAAFNWERLYECAVWVFLCQLWILAMKCLHQLVKFGLRDTVTAGEGDYNGDNVNHNGESGESDASSDGDSESDASSESEGVASSENESEEAQSGSGSADTDVNALALAQIAQQVLVADADTLEDCKARLFYQMFAHGVVEFVHDGHVFQLTRDVVVTKQ